MQLQFINKKSCLKWNHAINDYNETNNKRVEECILSNLLLNTNAGNNKFGGMLVVYIV